MDSTKNIASSTPPQNLPSEVMKLFKKIKDSEQDPDQPRGGVSYRYDENTVSGTFTFPIRAVDTPGGELLTVVNFLK